jgi:hypothetical protein
MSKATTGTKTSFVITEYPCLFAITAYPYPFAITGGIVNFMDHALIEEASLLVVASSTMR